jgi:hypothetical protein
MKPNKLKRLLETVHAECVRRTREFIHRRLDKFIKQKQAFAKVTTVTSKSLLASFKVPYRISKCKKKKKKLIPVGKVYIYLSLLI